MTTSAVPAIVLSYGLNGLGAVRSLGVAGIPVWSIVHSNRETSARSRYCRYFIRHEGERASEAVRRLCSEIGLARAVVLPTSDLDALELSTGGADLPEGILFKGPGERTLQCLVDKRIEIEQLTLHGARLPRSITSLPVGASTVEEALPLPIIVKPRTQAISLRVGFKNIILHERSELESFLQDYSSILDLFVAQEVVPGEDEDTWVCNAVFNSSSRMVSAHTFQRLGMSPPHFGVTTFALSRKHEAVLEETERIAGALGYVGPGMMEYKIDPRDGLPRYIETNPRLGMCNWFDTRCGVNNAYRAYLLTLGDEDSLVPSQVDGSYFLDLYGDLYSRISDDREPLASVIHKYRRLVGSRRVGAYLVASDPGPVFASLRRRLRQVVAAGGRRSRRMVAPERPSATKRTLVRAASSSVVRPLLNLSMRNRMAIFLLHRARDAERHGSGHEIEFIDAAIDRLKACGLGFLSLGEVAQIASGKARLVQPAVAFSIDDGYRDQTDMAEHFLSRGIPVTLFVITDLVDGRDWPWDSKVTYCIRNSRHEQMEMLLDDQRQVLPLWRPADRLLAARRLREYGKSLRSDLLPEFLASLVVATGVKLPRSAPRQYSPADWDRLRALAAKGLTVAPHCRSHRVMSSLSDDEARQELEWSWDRVRQEIPSAEKILAWPTGRHRDFTERDRRLAEEIGFLAAFATNDAYAELSPSAGRARFGINRFSLPQQLEDVIQCGLGIERLKQSFRARS